MSLRTRSVLANGVERSILCSIRDFSSRASWSRQTLQRYIDDLRSGARSAWKPNYLEQVSYFGLDQCYEITIFLDPIKLPLAGFFGSHLVGG